jgi:ribosome maturation factor RimP
MPASGEKFEEKIIAEVTPLVEDLLDHEGMELVDMTYRCEAHGWVLRVLIDKEGGVTIDDCGFISQQLGDVLDVKDIMRYSYKLEVSSPGLDRPLRKPADFKRFTGSLVRLKTREPLDNARSFIGRIIEVSADEIFLDVNGRRLAIPHAAVEKAHLEPEFPRAGHGGRR